MYFGHEVWHAGTKFPDQGPNPHPVQWKCCLNTWTAWEVPIFWTAEKKPGEQKRKEQSEFISWIGW